MLSSCQSGIGPQLHDGTLSLATAFLMAGACSVGSTLWKIPDGPTAVLMDVFYNQLTHGASVAAAMRAAQWEVKKLPQWVSPAFWAGFKVEGSGRNPLAVAC
jgi:CHAT domain-containing protein